MEPSFNPALEAQAIGRIHRLGQKRPVEIVRLVVKNSVEERMVGNILKRCLRWYLGTIRRSMQVTRK
jgi:SNF2 family DNA or RNA helicase